ncbi:hypothetical protein B1M_23161 [Burkholderia sp. TJI49]|nr:hypothetical protein B1M_23161 [Burkholderia sp. TJI49]
MIARAGNANDGAADAPLWFGILLDAESGCNRAGRRRAPAGGR